ncbi:thioesterase II family protein [Actinospica robiniae]|uniref:thioesterase II family protein n=1 Tax=Actinospica robiniae TaxID=304901 RepID=UPI0003F4B96F|nr:alpha/beta fold hydrolase [Actinospica robiniae]
MTDRWLRVLRPVARPRLRLVCLPHAGGTASFFQPWAELMPPDVELLAVRYPGRHDRYGDPFAESMEQLADPVAAALEPLLDRPIALFGHSMGATVGYEVAVRLEAAGRPPVRLFVSSRRAPHLPFEENLADLPDDDLVAEVRKLGGVDDGLLDLPEMRAIALPSLRADYRLVTAYCPAEPVKTSVPVVAYTGLADPGCTLDEARAWAELSLGGFELRVFPGDHFYLVPERETLLAHLFSRLR